ncbi:hypothetical protein HCN44_010229 [Aphidius gifuensis]|uniref:Uncharacterized protein n=1 Tax=Aphidius gifuensis TaxID=684658 RepID=A0A835CS76_APHGI|nr:hypothetical protein HCN44_010229 [Aphidius gifuensis]
MTPQRPKISNNQQSNYKLFVGIFGSIIRTMATFTWNFCDLLIILVSIGLAERYKNLNKVVRFKISNNSAKKINWSKIKDKYVIINELVKEANNIVSPLILISCCMNEYRICVHTSEGIRCMQNSPEPLTRCLIAKGLATLFSAGDTFLLFDTINKCYDILKNKDDTPSFLPTKLSATCCVGAMYEKLDVHQQNVEMLNHTPFLCINEIESMASICFRAFEDINYRVRCSVAKLLGTLVAMTQLSSSQTLFNKNNHKNISSSLSDGGDDNCGGNGVPSQITPLIDNFIEKICKMTCNNKEISGYSCALSAIIGCVLLSSLGIPHTKGKIIFNTAEK